jgi:hypothetical protein
MSKTQTGPGETVEWFTPAYILNAAIAVLGAIDCDPASPPPPYPVPATTHYTRAENGLLLPWDVPEYLKPARDCSIMEPCHCPCHTQAVQDAAVRNRRINSSPGPNGHADLVPGAESAIAPTPNSGDKSARPNRRPSSTSSPPDALIAGGLNPQLSNTLHPGPLNLMGLPPGAESANVQRNGIGQENRDANAHLALNPNQPTILLSSVAPDATPHTRPLWNTSDPSHASGTDLLHGAVSVSEKSPKHGKPSGEPILPNAPDCSLRSNDTINPTEDTLRSERHPSPITTGANHGSNLCPGNGPLPTGNGVKPHGAIGAPIV